MKNAIHVLIVAAIIFLPAFCFAQSNYTESLTITTYYPSPYGVYRNLKLNPTAEEPSGPALSRGVMYYNDSENVIKYRNNETWVDIGKVNAISDDKPADVAGAVYYDNSDKSIKYYNGTSWVDIGGSNVTQAGAGYWAENTATHYISNNNTGGKVIITGPPDANGEILQVEGDMRVYHRPPLGDGNTLLYLTRQDQTKQDGIVFTSWGGSDPSGYALRQWGNPSKLSIGSGATNYLTVDSSTGRVGVGTTSPYAPFTVGIKTSNTAKATLTQAWQNEDISTGENIQFSVHMYLNDPLAYFYRTAEFYCPVNSVAGNPTMNLQFTNPNPGAKFRFQMGNEWQTANGAKLLIEETRVTMGTAARNVGLQVNGDIRYTGTIADNSDQRLKKNIKPLTNVIKKLEKIDAVNFDWRAGEFSDRQFSEGRQIGMIAQQVEKEFPELVFSGEDGYKSLDYTKFTVVLLGAIKEQQSQIESLKQEIKTLKKTR